MRSLLLLAVLGAAVTGCLWNAAEAREWSRLEAEGEIFSAVMDSVFGSLDSDRLLVRATTSRGFIQEQLPDVFRRSMEEFPDLNAEAAADFLRINQEPRRIQAIEHHRFRVEIVDDSVFAGFHDDDSPDPREYWTRVRDRFGGATTIVSFSRPGFSVDRNEAFVVVNYGCGSLCGAGYNILMRRSADGWHVARLVNTWVS